MMKVEIEVQDIPEGWELIGIRSPDKNDYYLAGNGEVLKALSPHKSHAKLIVRKKRTLRKMSVAEVELGKEYRGYFTDVDREVTFGTVENMSPQHLFGIRVGNTDYAFLNSTGGRYRYFWAIEE